MIWTATSPCTWSAGRYLLVYSKCGFEIENVKVFVEGVKVHEAACTDKDTALQRAQDWCERHANPVPELDLPVTADAR